MGRTYQLEACELSVAGVRDEDAVDADVAVMHFSVGIDKVQSLHHGLESPYKGFLFLSCRGLGKELFKGLDMLDNDEDFARLCCFGGIKPVDITQQWMKDCFKSVQRISCASISTSVPAAVISEAKTDESAPLSFRFAS